MATRPWLGDLKTRKKTAKTREERLVASIVGGRGEAPAGEPKGCWVRLVVWALALERPGKFAQVAVPREYVEEIAAVAERSGMVARIGDSLTEGFRVLTLWEPPALAALREGASL
jgi:hypothetical protein